MAHEDPVRRRSMLGVAAYLLVPGERRRRAAGHFGRAAIEAAKGVRSLYVPSRSELERSDATPSGERTSAERNAVRSRQRIEIN